MDRTPWIGHWRCVHSNECELYLSGKKKEKKYNVVLCFMIAVNDFVSNEILEYHTHVQLLAIQLSIPSLL